MPNKRVAHARPIEDLVSGVMDELRALRADVEKLQKDKVESLGAAETQTTNDFTTPPRVPPQINVIKHP